MKEWERFNYNEDDPENTLRKAVPVLTQESRSKPNFTCVSWSLLVCAVSTLVYWMRVERPVCRYKLKIVLSFLQVATNLA